MFEVITNFTYLLKNDGLKLARKQHGEIPKDVSDDKVKIKVLCMSISGIIFLSVGIMSFICKSVNRYMYIIVLMIFALYAFMEALHYKYWKTVGFAFVSILLAMVFIFS